MELIAIVGGSIGGVRVAQALRSERYDGEIRIFSDEPGLPYDRPPLSKALITGDCEPHDANLVSEEQIRSLGITVVPGTTATGVDTKRQLLEVTGASPVSYDRLVIATGSSAVVPSWAQVDGVFTLRTLSDGLAVRNLLDQRKRLAVVGAGFIGSEVAAAARKADASVYLIDPLDRPMARALDEVTGAWFERLHTEQGVAMVLGHGVTDAQRVDGNIHVGLDNGSHLEVDAVVLGVGARPNTSWLEGSGFHIDDGVCCDEYGRCVGADNVFAVGDVACWNDSKGGVARRHEHWTSAVNQAACVAHNIVHPEDLRSDDNPPYVWSDQYHWKAHIVGDTHGNRRRVLGDPHVDGRAAALYADHGGLLAGAVVINWPRASILCRRAVGGHVPMAEIADKLRVQLVKVSA